MFCRNCGRQLPERARFCPDCGETIVYGNEQDDKIAAEEIENVILGNEQGIQCPICGSTGCKGHYKQDTKGGGYGCLQGGLGFLLAGPLGLLCGLCGRSIKTTNTLMWVCPNCGRQFRSRSDIYQNIQNNAAKTPVIFAVYTAIANLVGLGNPATMVMLWVLLLALGGVCVYSTWNLPKEDYGVDIREFLTDSERIDIIKTVQKKSIGLAIMAVLFVLILILQ